MDKERDENNMELKEFIANNKQKIHQVCSDGLKRDEQGRVLLDKNDEWRNEKEWDQLFKELDKDK